MADFNRGDLEFILTQIKIAEQLAAGVPLTQIEGGVLAQDPTLPFGLRTVSGIGNNLIDENFGAADQAFPNQVPGPVVPNNEGDGDTFDPDGPGPANVANTNYGIPGDVADADPRIISNLAVDQSLDNPSAVFAALKHAGIEGADAQAAYDAIMAAYTAVPGAPNQAVIDAALAARNLAQAQLSVAQTSLQVFNTTSLAYQTAAGFSETAKDAAENAKALLDALVGVLVTGAQLDTVTISTPALVLANLPLTPVTLSIRAAVNLAQTEASRAALAVVRAGVNNDLVDALQPAGVDFVAQADINAAQALQARANAFLTAMNLLDDGNGTTNETNGIDQGIAATNTDVARFVGTTPANTPNAAKTLADLLNNVPASTGNSAQDLDTQIDLAAAAAAINAAAAQANVNTAQTQFDAAEAAYQAALAGTSGPTLEQVLDSYGLTMENGSLVIEAVAPDEGLSAPANGWFTLFGQFFDHGLDLVAKGGYGTVYIPLQPDDPLYDHTPGARTNFMVVTRATRDLQGNEINTTSPFVDQNQTYSSHESHQVFLRAYDLVGGKPQASGKLIEGANGGMATWADLKLQAAQKLGILLTDNDVTRVPLLAADEYGNFTPGPNGFPQIVLAAPNAILDPDGNGLVEGNPLVPVPASLAIATGHAFLDDIAHNAAPGTVFDTDGIAATPGTSVVQADADGDTGNAIDTDFRGRKVAYDNELLDAHFIAGDGRVNENIGLTAVHHVFHSEHNRLAEQTKATILATNDLAFLNQWLDVPAVGPFPTTPAAIAALDWNGERLFQAAKFGTEMQYQHLVFEEFARKVQPQVNIFAGYDVTIDPKIVAEFAHAVYRFGHSQLRESVDRVGADGNLLQQLDANGTPLFLDVDGNLTTVDTGTKAFNQMGLIEAFLNPVAFTATGGGDVPDSADVAAGAIVRGMSRQVGSQIDEFVTGALRNNLLGLPLDLATINIARARETGVPTLNEFREQMHALTGDPKLTPYTSWIDFAAHAKHELSVVNFIAAYGTHSAITSATTLVDKRAAALELVLGFDADGDPTALAGRDDFLNGTGAFANRRGGLDNVDLWIGGLAEAIEPFGGLLGSTFNFVFEIQLEKLQDGDRFYYLTRTAGLNFLTQLEGNSFASLIQRNTDLNLNESDQNHFSTHLPADIFSTPAYILEAHVALQQDFNGVDAGKDPTGDSIFRPLVIRRDTNNDGNAEYLEYTGVDHVVLGGTNRNDHLKAGIGDDTLSGDGGNDRLEGGDGADTLIGGTGDDILIDVGGAGDNLKGGDGNDVLISGSGEALLLAGSGKDYVLGGQDLKETFGGDGDDFVNAGDSSNTVFGGEGNDWIEGGDQADLLQGDNGAPFQDSPIIGNDVILGGGGNDDYDAESGDDILVADTGITRHEGMLGFDWVTHKDDPFAANSDFLFTGALLPAVETNRDRFDQVEGLSGWQFDDVLRGDNTDVAGGLLVGHELTNFGLITGLRGNTAANLFGNATTIFTGGNIILGGGGSDIIEGRGGNEIIDGDRWLNVRIEVRGTNGTTILGTVDSMQGLFTGGPNGNTTAAGVTAGLVGKRLNELMESGAINPGQLHIVREILNGGVSGDIDYAEFSGNIGDYTISTTVDARGFRTVTHNNGGIDGVDLVRNVEVLQFADGRALFGVTNSAATGELDLIGNPAVGQTFSLANDPLNGLVVDADGPLPALSTFQVTWQVELDPGAAPGVFTDIVDPITGATFTGPTFTPLPGMELESLRIRARATFIDAAGLREVVVSNASLGLAANVVSPTPTAGADTIFGTLAGDLINPLAGDDVVFGFGGADTLIGDATGNGDGNDILDGGVGNDTAQFNGAVGNYTLQINAEGNLEVINASGLGSEDAVINVENLLFTAPAVDITLSHADVMATLAALALDPATDPGGISVAATGGADVLAGTAAANTIDAGGGDDVIFGLGGNDTINGEAGDDLIVWRAIGPAATATTDGRDLVNGGGDTGVGDTFEVVGATGTEIFQVVAVAGAANAANRTAIIGAHGPLAANTEIVITREVGGTTTLIAELDNIEELLINNVVAPAAGGGAGGDNVIVTGDFTNTSLLLATITINGSSADDTVDITGLTSAHRIVFRSHGGDDTIVGTLRPQDVVELAQGLTPANYDAPEYNDNGTWTITQKGGGHSITYTGGPTMTAPTFAAGSGSDGGGSDDGDDDTQGGSSGSGSGSGSNSGSGSGSNSGSGTGGSPMSHVVFAGTGGNDAVFGSDNKDMLAGADGNDTIFGYGGNDDIVAGDGSDEVFAGAGNDIVSGGAGADRIFTDEGDDIVLGGAGNDTIDTGAGNDKVWGDADRDVIHAGTGNDVLFASGGGDGNDAYHGDEGTDTVDFTAIEGGLTIDLGGAGVGFARGGDNGDDVLGSIENVIGGSGNDTIVAGGGVNVMNGGGGNDTFVFNSATSANGDKIEGFHAGDKIDLSAVFGATGTPATALPAGSSFTATGQLRLSVVDGDTLIEGNIDGNPNTDFSITVVDRIITRDDLN